MGGEGCVCVCVCGRARARARVRACACACVCAPSCTAPFAPRSAASPACCPRAPLTLQPHPAPSSPAPQSPETPGRGRAHASSSTSLRSALRAMHWKAASTLMSSCGAAGGGERRGRGSVIVYARALCRVCVCGRACVRAHVCSCARTCISAVDRAWRGNARASARLLNRGPGAACIELHHGRPPAPPRPGPIAGPWPLAARRARRAFADVS
jgi:hypothetical protein